MALSNRRNKIVMARLRARRKQLKLTQREVSQRAGLAQAMTYFYEKGYKDPSSMNLVKLAAALECTIDYLLGTSPYPKKSAIQLTPVVPVQEDVMREVEAAPPAIVIVDRAPFQEAQS